MAASLPRGFHRFQGSAHHVPDGGSPGGFYQAGLIHDIVMNGQPFKPVGDLLPGDEDERVLFFEGLSEFRKGPKSHLPDVSLLLLVEILKKMNTQYASGVNWNSVVNMTAVPRVAFKEGLDQMAQAIEEIRTQGKH